MRAALLALVALTLIAAPALAEKCVSSLTYQKKGGDLDNFTIPDDVPDEIVRCASQACSGEADIKMVVEQDGSVGDVLVTMTDAKDPTSDQRSQLLRRWLSNLKFVPPVLDTKPVCVNLEFSFGFAQKRSKSTP
ncbi:MAG: hypothetical protein P4L57_04345 [Rhizomicrobium sp.]|nr:hypothetical protein [Rhizomicrobium sp.]